MSLLLSTKYLFEISSKAATKFTLHFSLNCAAISSTRSARGKMSEMLMKFHQNCWQATCSTQAHEVDDFILKKKSNISQIACARQARRRQSCTSFFPPHIHLQGLQTHVNIVHIYMSYVFMCVCHIFLCVLVYIYDGECVL